MSSSFTWTGNVVTNVSVQGAQAASKDIERVGTSSRGASRAVGMMRGNMLGLYFTFLFATMSAQRIEDAQDRYNDAVKRYGANSEQAARAQKDINQAQQMYNITMSQMIFTTAMATTQMLAEIGVLAKLKAALFGVGVMRRFASMPLILGVGGGLGLTALTLMLVSGGIPGMQTRQGEMKSVARTGLAIVHKGEEVSRSIERERITNVSRSIEIKMYNTYTVAERGEPIEAISMRQGLTIKRRLKSLGVG